MKKTAFSDFIEEKIEKIKSFLISKDLLIFLFFLMVSTGLWILQALHKDYETIITVPVEYINMPEGLIQTKRLPDILHVTVTDGGTTLVKYRLAKHFNPVIVDASEYAEGYDEIETMSFSSEIQRQLNTSTKIIKISPDIIEMNLSELEKKELDVRFCGSYTISQQYVQTDSLVISPKKVTVYSIKDILDTMQYAYTEDIELNDIKDTFKTKLKLKEIENVSYQPQDIYCEIRTEPYTENELEVPIEATNVPTGYHMKTFPAKVKVKYHIAFSKFKEITPHTFKVKADYHSIKDTKVPLSIDIMNSLPTHVSITPKSVDFIIEKDT